MLAVALKDVFRTALTGRCDARPELAAARIPLEIGVPALRCRGGADPRAPLFEPLGWSVEAAASRSQTRRVGRLALPRLRLAGELRLADALNHLYVLLPVLDDAKHYWVATDEVDKLIRAGGGWLAGHPEKELITRRYLAHQRELTQSALARLAEADDTEPEELDNAVEGARNRGPRPAERRWPSSAAGRSWPRSARAAPGGSATSAAARARSPATCSPTPHRAGHRGRRVRPGAAARRAARPQAGPDDRAAARAAADLPVLADLPRRPAGRAGRGGADGGHRARRPAPAGRRWSGSSSATPRPPPSS